MAALQAVTQSFNNHQYECSKIDVERSLRLVQENAPQQEAEKAAGGGGKAAGSASSTSAGTHNSHDIEPLES